MSIEKRTNIEFENAVIIGIQLPSSDEKSLFEELDELILLADTAGAKVLDRVVQKKSKIDPATFIGKGKAISSINIAKGLDCTILLFNNDLSPAQLKNLQKLAGDELKVIDRSGLIIDIFEKHAKTKEARIQVKLARLKYLLPRLTRQWTHLERQMGGVGTRGGPGETQIEVDRRLISRQIAKLNNQLKAIQSQRSTQHKSRDNIYKVSLSGYTNSGKSTIMRLITNSKIYIQNQLFATLDTTTRKVSNKNRHEFLLSDTVGFIRNLPHDLIASFRSTLMEIEESDLIIKVLDASSSDIEKHFYTIDEVLKTLNLSSPLELVVFNKIDLVDSDIIYKLKSLYPESVFISAGKELKIDDLIGGIQDKLSTLNIVDTIYIPYPKLSIIDYIYGTCRVLFREDQYEQVMLKIESSPQNISKIKSKIKYS